MDSYSPIVPEAGKFEPLIGQNKWHVKEQASCSSEYSAAVKSYIHPSACGAKLSLLLCIRLLDPHTSASRN